MSLRPRYSLLTLLVLTALVAGGVKLWYGPHHVVERTDPRLEGEYSFTRDLLGNRIIQGPFIVRRYFSDGTMYMFAVFYYRQGQKVNWRSHHVLESDRYLVTGFRSDEDLLVNSTLSREEYSEFKHAIAREVEKLPSHAAGLFWNEFESRDY